MKLTKEQIQAVFSGLGIAQAVEIVNSIEEADSTFNADETLNSFIATKEPIYLTKFNESVLPNKIKEVAGEFGGKLNGYIRKASNNQIPLVDLQDLSDADKISKLVEILDANKGKDSEELRGQLIKAIEEHTVEIDKLKTDHQTALSLSDNKLVDYRISDYLTTKILPTIPLVDGDVSIRTNLLKSAMSEKYHLMMNEKNELEFRDKENIEKPIIVDNNKFLNPSDFATEYLTGLGIVKKDNRHDETETDKGGNQQNQSSFSNTGIDKTTNDALANL
ncbi:MAG: hypothetical protein RR578_03535 [Bacilli bacterium]|uniref:hypothetical protein n=1 Tax=Algoriella sp. TaxID=1872434 RepID=UPI002FCB4D4C